MPANMKKAGMKYKMGGSRKKVMSKEKMGDTGYMYGGSMKKKKMKKGGSLKEIPSGNKGLPKLPTAVRNKMGYMKDGGSKKVPVYTHGGQRVPGMYQTGGNVAQDKNKNTLDSLFNKGAKTLKNLTSDTTKNKNAGVVIGKERMKQHKKMYNSNKKK